MQLTYFPRASGQAASEAVEMAVADPDQSGLSVTQSQSPAFTQLLLLTHSSISSQISSDTIMHKQVERERNGGGKEQENSWHKVVKTSSLNRTTLFNTKSTCALTGLQKERKNDVLLEGQQTLNQFVQLSNHSGLVSRP